MTAYAINSTVGWRKNGDAVIAMNCQNQLLAVWNESASLLWELIIEGHDKASLVKTIRDTYGIDEKVARRDVNSFLGSLRADGFISGNSISRKGVTQRNVIHDDNPENVLNEIEMRSIKNLIPYSITFETTYACNENCIHCFMDRGGHVLTTEESKRILNEIATEGCFSITFTGGEFFTRRDVAEIIEEASKLHFVIDILSNGTLINDDIVQSLVNKPIRRVQISVYGVDAATHDFVTRVPGSFVKTIAAIKRLVAAEIKTEITIPFFQMNFDQCYAIMALGEELGCIVTPTHLITARNNGAVDTYHLRLTEDQLEEYWRDERISVNYSGRKPFAKHQIYLNIENIQDAAPCYSGFNTCAINPEGKVYPCNQFLYEIGDLRESTFGEIWHNSQPLEFLRTLKVRDLTQCSSCELLENCSRCPGLAMLEGGNLYGISPENCRNARIIKKIGDERR